MTMATGVRSSAAVRADGATVSVLVVHRSAVIADGLRLALSRWPAVRGIGGVADADAALELAVRRRPDVAMIDTELKPAGPWDLVERLSVVLPALRVLLFTPGGDAALLRRGRRLGVAGYVKQGSTQDTIGLALERVAAGGEFVDPDLAVQMLLDAPGEGLTERERQVLQLMADGDANSVIAEKLGIGEETVKTHVRRILGKMQARSRAHAVALGLRQGLVR
jgi:DNA-binding NarL/FixJ family response regulator